MFYDRLRDACRRKNITPTALTRELGLVASNITRWRTGGYPSVEVLMQMSRFLGCSADYLLGNVDDPEIELVYADVIDLSPRDRLTKSIEYLPNEDIPKVQEYVDLLLLKRKQ